MDVWMYDGSFVGCQCLACLLGDRWKIKIVTFIHTVGKIKCDESDRQQQHVHLIILSTLKSYISWGAGGNFGKRGLRLRQGGQLKRFLLQDCSTVRLLVR